MLSIDERFKTLDPEILYRYYRATAEPFCRHEAIKTLDIPGDQKEQMLDEIRKEIVKGLRSFYAELLKSFSEPPQG